jgi:hypothetical protein
MSTHKQTWKNFEETVAIFFSTHRMPLSGMSNNLSKGDIIHSSLHVEAKLREQFNIVVKYAQVQKKNITLNKPPLVFQFSNFKKYSKGFLWFFYFDYLRYLGKSAKKAMHPSGTPHLIVFKKYVTIVDTKADSLVKLYSETEKIAEKENKIPLVALKMKNKHGWYIVINPCYLSEINNKIEIK